MLLALALFLSASDNAQAFSSHRVNSDPVTQSSIIDGDATGLIEGCGNQTIVGGTFCRQEEGDAANKSVWFIGPPAQCSRENCVFFKVWNTQGRLVWGGMLPKGATRIEVPWSTLLERPTFQLGDRGFWTFNTTVYWLDQNGLEKESISQGDIVLRVFKHGYSPLDSVAQDPNFVWVWTEKGRIYRMTAGLRAYVGK